MERLAVEICSAQRKRGGGCNEGTSDFPSSSAKPVNTATTRCGLLPGDIPGRTHRPTQILVWRIWPIRQKWTGGATPILPGSRRAPDPKAYESIGHRLSC